MGDSKGDLRPVLPGQGLPLPTRAYFPSQQLSWTTIMVQQNTATDQGHRWTGRRRKVFIPLRVFLLHVTRQEICMGHARFRVRINQSINPSRIRSRPWPAKKEKTPLRDAFQRSMGMRVGERRLAAVTSDANTDNRAAG
jgi:hypothetical protein